MGILAEGWRVGAVAAGLDCNPVELLAVEAQEESERGGGG